MTHRTIVPTSLLLLFAGLAPAGAQAARFEVATVLEVGRAPHQIDFSADGSTAYIAAAGSNHIAVVDVATQRVTTEVPSDRTPLGVVALDSGRLVVSRFAADRLAMLASDGHVVRELHVGGGPSLIVGPLPKRRYLVSIEKENVVRVIDAETLTVVRSYPTGRRPFPAAATSDGRLGFVPNYDDGTVTVVDLWNERIRDVVPVGPKPSGAVVLPGELEVAVAVRGENRVVFLDTASFNVTGLVEDGIGEGPFSIVATTDGRFAFVNNAESNDISVLDLERRRVIQRLSVGAKPIAMAVHPTSDTLWIASEGSHTVSIVPIPASPTRPTSNDGPRAQVAVLGMTHGTHRDSTTWGLAQVQETIRRFAPDIVCAEIPPNRWARARDSFAERGAIEESRVVRFPEYTDVVFALAKEMNFEIVPCAGWTQEMSDLRRTRLAAFDAAPRWAATKREYDAKIADARSRRPSDATMDDPRFIHSQRYDDVMREELEIYDEYLNDWIGPGGWSHINDAHVALVVDTIESHPGKRILVTFGGGHKYKLLEALRDLDDVTLLDAALFLPDASETLPPMATNEMEARGREEVFELHQFFEDWFGGVIPQNDGLGRVRRVLAEDFEIVSPEGQASTRDAVLARLEAAYGVHRDGGVRIWVENFRSRGLGEGTSIATYEEWQRIAGATTVRLSTVVFARAPDTPNGVRWQHVHETWKK